MQILDLSWNAFKGDASMFFGSTKQTSDLVLAMNSFAFDFGKVELPKNLGKLDLRNNKIYGTLPEGLTELKLLNFFYVGYNKLCGQIPQGGNFTWYGFMRLVMSITSACVVLLFPPARLEFNGSHKVI